jgi:uncharacterized protein
VLIIPKIMEKFFGREKELQTIRRLIQSKRSEFLAVYGRRRVGKTMLIREALQQKFTFRLTAIGNATKNQQLVNFHRALKNSGTQNTPLPVPNNWFDAFQQLIEFLEASKEERKLIFFDELPWFDTAKSDFMPSLEHFWNSWASYRSDVFLVVCGSAASWMINKLINHKGGLHNRLTARIRLEPFTLKEAEMMLKDKNSAIDRYQAIQIFMVTGGIPFYLSNFDGELSAMQNIENLCFTNDGPLRNEFNNLFPALFSTSERHISIVEAIAGKNKGLTRAEVIESTRLPNNGSTTKLLMELEESGFVRKYIPFGRDKRESLYQLIDLYTLFYLKFIRNGELLDENNWINAMESSTYRAWSGYAFELVCLCHIQQIKQGLSIAGMVTKAASWRGKNWDKSTQVDLLIDRHDHVINLCEIKFSQQQFTITKEYAAQLERKIAIFKEDTSTKKAVWLTMLTTFGLFENEYSRRLVQKSLTMDVLFN